MSILSHRHGTTRFSGQKFTKQQARSGIVFTLSIKAQPDSSSHRLRVCCIDLKALDVCIAEVQKIR